MSNRDFPSFYHHPSLDIVTAIAELYRKAATELPPDVYSSLKSALSFEEKGSVAHHTLSVILRNIDLAREKARPMCQDTGTPIFFVRYGPDYRQKMLLEYIEQATIRATDEVPLRPNTTDILSGRNSGNNVSVGIPVVYFEEVDAPGCEMGLLLKGGGCENVGKTYSLPNISLGAGRDLEGIRRCVLDCVVNAQGQGCPPMIASVVAGSPDDLVTVLAKRQLLRRIGSENPETLLVDFERRLTDEINSLGIGPGGFGGKNTVLTTFVSTAPRHPASFFVHVSFFCWASRRAKLTWRNNKAHYAL